MLARKRHVDQWNRRAREDIELELLVFVQRCLKYTLEAKEPYLSDFSFAGMIANRERGGKSGLFWLEVQGYSSSLWENHSSRSLGQLVTLLAQRPISQVALNLSELTIEINHHNRFQKLCWKI